MRVFIGGETSGVLRRAFRAMGHDAWSCDVLPAEDSFAHHIVGDMFDGLDQMRRLDGWVPDLAIFHPTCTMHTLAGAWAFKDPDFDRYPGVGYHQKVGPGTLVGGARRVARLKAEAEVERIKALPIRVKVIENPRGTLPTRTSLGKPIDVVQPYEFGDDASKATCLWAFDYYGKRLPHLKLRRNPSDRILGRFVNGVERWSNQTDTGQNRLTPGPDRWSQRSRTYEGIAWAIAAQLPLVAHDILNQRDTIAA
jgi:hypothetical protein